MAGMEAPYELNEKNDTKVMLSFFSFKGQTKPAPPN
jgi:hypothetical protein